MMKKDATVVLESEQVNISMGRKRNCSIAWFADFAANSKRGQQAKNGNVLKREQMMPPIDLKICD